VVADEAEATSQMQEYAARTDQDGNPRFARDHRPPAVEPAAMPLRVERWLVDGRVEYSVLGIAWGGPEPLDGWEIRFGSADPYVRVEHVMEGREGSWRFWTHAWRPHGPGEHTIRLRLAATDVSTRRLDAGHYARTVVVPA
jgi:hypothetical protein